MKTRYDLMNLSNTEAPDGSMFPDIMTFDIQKFKFTDSPNQYYINEIDLYRSDIFTFNYFGSSEFDDFVFWINGVDNIHNLELEQELQIPTLNNMEEFYLRYRR